MMTSTKQYPALLTGVSSLMARFFALAPANALASAIAQRQITPVYQPIIDSQTGRIAGVEVLARWKHPLYGHISPDTFIPLAEKQNLIAPLTHQLIQQVISDLQYHIHLFPKGMYISLNLSAWNCLDPRFETDTVELLQRLAASQVQLVIEITEKHPLHFTPELCEWFATLRRANIAIALDDFGTGYSNLSWIAALAPEFIKIDKLFISQIIENGDTRLVEGLIELARKMQLTVIAEGVETQHQVDYLREKAIAFMQGYYFARPVPAGELIRMTVAQHGYAS